MKLALIPPIKHLDFTDKSDMQLMLPQLLRNGVYADKYSEHLVKRRYMILDNGAAEGEKWSFQQLGIIAREYSVNEIVLPDVMGDATATFDLAFDAIGSMGDWSIRPKYGVVATGKSEQEAYSLVNDIFEYFPSIPVIYIPRLLITRHNLMARINLASQLHKLLPEVEIHFLGASPYYTNEILAAARLGFVRSMDTSMPFSYAAQNVRVDAGYWLNRPDHYFNLELNEEQLETAKYNVYKMQRWADGRA